MFGLVAGLVEHGWRATVVAGAAREGTPEAAELPPSARVVRARDPRVAAAALQLVDRLRGPTRGWVAAWPDDAVGWALGAFRAALHTARREQPAAVLSSGPPMTAHVVAREVVQRPRLPWVADFADEWANGAALAPAAEPVRKASRRLEATIAGEADRLVFARGGVDITGADLTRAAVVGEGDALNLAIILDRMFDEARAP
jgi:hypothetical protein